LLILQIEFFFLQISETSADERGVSERLGRGAGHDVEVDRLMWNAVCVVGRRLAGQNNNNNNNNNKMEQVKLRSITFSLLQYNMYKKFEVV
jgi:hypothetical protein